MRGPAQGPGTRAARRKKAAGRERARFPARSVRASSPCRGAFRHIRPMNFLRFLPLHTEADATSPSHKKAARRRPAQTGKRRQRPAGDLSRIRRTKKPHAHAAARRIFTARGRNFTTKKPHRLFLCARQALPGKKRRRAIPLPAELTVSFRPPSCVHFLMNTFSGQIMKHTFEKEEKNHITWRKSILFRHLKPCLARCETVSNKHLNFQLKIV